MASISEQRLKEMEAEMNRFEQEIAPPDGVGGFGMIIGSNTFNTVEAQLRQIRHETTGGAFLPPPPPPPICISQSQAPPAEPTNDLNVPISTLAPPPPPPPPPEPAPDQQPPPLMSPPPPPPPLLNRPAFVPPQLRHRAPLPPRPPMHHHMGHGPHGYHGPPGPGPMGPMGPGPGPYHHPNMMGPGPMGPGPMGPGPMGPGPMGPPMMQQGPMGFPPQGPYHQQGFPMMGNGEGGNMMGNQGGPMDNADSSNSAVIEAKPKMIYSAAPVRTVPKKTKKGKREEKAKTEESAGSVEPSSLAEAVAFSSVSMSANIDGEMFAAPMGQDEVMVAEMELDNDVSMPTKKGKKEKKKKFIRTAANTVWEDPTLEEWDPDDFRMFCGDLGNEVTDESLQRAFSKYPTFVKAKVVRDRRTNKTKGYGFASFKDPQDFTRAMREMNGKYVGNRPIKLRKSTWKDRNIEIVRKKEKEKKRLGLK